MRHNLLIVAALVLALCGVASAGCKKAKPARSDPHSIEGVMSRLQQQERLLNEAFIRKDFGYIHDYGYYFTSLTQALFSKLNDEQRLSLRSKFDELVGLSQQLDRAAGGRREQATEATLQRLQAVLSDIDTQLRGAKPGG